MNVIVAADWNNLDWSTTEDLTRERGKREMGEKKRLERGLPLTACNFSIIASSSCTCKSAPSPSPCPCPCLSCSAWEVCCPSKRGASRFGSLDCVAPDFWLPRSASDFPIVPRIESNSESMSRSSLFGSSSGSGDQSLASSASSRRGRPVFSITEVMGR